MSGAARQRGNAGIDQRNLAQGRLPAAVIALGLVALALLVYLPLMPRAPVHDDGPVALDHPAVRTGAGLLLEPYARTPFRPLWRPLATTTFHWNWQLTPGPVAHVAPRHLADARRAMGGTNAGLFALALVLLFLVLRRGSGWSRGVCAAAAALVLLHPVQTESVLRLAGRAELLSLVLMLGALLLYLGPLRTGTLRSGRAVLAWVAAGLLAVLALLAHELALVLPLLILGYEWTLGTASAPAVGGAGAVRKAVRGRVAWIAVAGSAAIVVLWAAAQAGVLRGMPPEVQGNPAPDYLAVLTDGERLRLALALPWLYLRVLVLAVPVLPSYAQLLARPEDSAPVMLGDLSTYWVHVPNGGEQAAGIAVVACVLIAFLFLRRRRPGAAWGAWIFAVTLVAALPLLARTGAVASVRGLFLPLAGLVVILFDLALARWPRASARAGPGPGARAWRWAASGLLIVLAVALGLTTRATGRAWSSQEALMERLAEHAPLSPEVPLYRANRALGQGDLATAVREYEVSLGLFPRNPHLLLNLGLVRAKQGEYSLARRVLGDATRVADRLLPGTRIASHAHLSLGSVLVHQQRRDGAIEELRKAVRAEPTNVEALARAGMLEVMRYETAHTGVEHLARALELDPEGHRLGILAPQVRELRQRALRNLRRWDGVVEEGGAAEGYDADMDTEVSGEELPEGSEREAQE